MVVDGGPDASVLKCLGRHMPFWDRDIDMVLMTHPQKDHFYGLISVISRYKVDYFLRSDVDNTTESYKQLLDVLAARRVPSKFLTSGDTIKVDRIGLSFIWPSQAQIAKGKNFLSGQSLQEVLLQRTILGISSIGDLNDYCLVFFLRYGSFDALFTGDADSRVEPNYTGGKLVPNVSEGLSDDTLEVLKVPHHGSKTGMTQDFVAWLRPKVAIISVGKNTYGHPSQLAIDALTAVGSRVIRTDKAGDIEVISDGTNWNLKTEKTPSQ